MLHTLPCILTEDKFTAPHGSVSPDRWSALYLKRRGVVTQEALVLQGDVDALFGPKVNPWTWGALLHVEHVLLQWSRSFGECFEVLPLICVGDDAGQKIKDTGEMKAASYIFQGSVRDQTRTHFTIEEQKSKPAQPNTEVLIRTCDEAALSRMNNTLTFFTFLQVLREVWLKKNTQTNECRCRCEVGGTGKAKRSLKSNEFHLTNMNLLIKFNGNLDVQLCKSYSIIGVIWSEV